MTYTLILILKRSETEQKHCKYNVTPVTAIQMF